MRGLAVRQRLRPWLIPAAVVVAATLLLWTTGGLRTVQATQGRPAEIGQEITLARWVLVVQRVELTNRTTYDTATPPTVRVYLRATFTGEASTYGLGPGLVEVQAPSGPAGIETSPTTDGERDGTFDPDVAQDISLAYPWPTAPATAPTELRVLIRDEAKTENYLFPTDWAAEPNVALHVDVPCEDRRVAG